MKKNILIKIILLLCGISNIAFADKTSEPTSFVIFSDDGKVVYINRLNGDKNSIYLWQGKGNVVKEEFSIKNYPKNGLYEVSNHKFLWQLEKNEKFSKTSFGLNFSVPFNDRRHMVVSGPNPSWLNDIAFEIYKDGILLKSFQVKDFCKNESTFLRSDSHFIWMDNYHVDTSKKEITFIACRNKFKVDVRTGKISSTPAADLPKMFE